MEVIRALALALVGCGALALVVAECLHQRRLEYERLEAQLLAEIRAAYARALAEMGSQLFEPLLDSFRQLNLVMKEASAALSRLADQLEGIDLHEQL